MNKPEFITNNDWSLLKNKYPHNIKKIVKKIKSGYPVQYLIGNVNFYGYQILIDERAFIPRPETELLVEKTLKLINFLNIKNKEIVDICSGSGCIAVTLSKELDRKIDAIEISKRTIKLAIKNNDINNAKVNFIKKDILKEKTLNYDIVISNPPYVNKHSKVDIQTKYEPQRALFPKKNELDFYQHILSIIKKDVLLISLEIGCNQAQNIIKLVKKELPDHKYKIEQDYAHKDRYIFIWK